LGRLGGAEGFKASLLTDALFALDFLGNAGNVEYPQLTW